MSRTAKTAARLCAGGTLGLLLLAGLTQWSPPPSLCPLPAAQARIQASDLAACTDPLAQRCVRFSLEEEDLEPFGLPNFKARWAQQTGWGDWAPGREWDPDSSGYDALHVALTAEPLFAAEEVAGEVVWTLRVLEDGLDRVTFDFYDTMTVSAAAIDGLPVLFTHADDRLSLHLAPPAARGDTLKARVSYQGQPVPGFLVGMKFDDHDGVPVVYTSTEPIASRTWWPCKDRPDDKFTADLFFVVPDTMIATGNGLLVEVTPLADERLCYHWQERYPLTTYLVALTATNFVQFHDTYVALDQSEMPVNYYAYPEDLERAQQDWAFTPQAITFLAETFGEYPFLEEKYGMVEYPWIGAMEHTTLSSMGEYFFRLDHPSDWVVVHELAHQWWGDWVTCGTWRDIWLNEGFATYCEALWAEHLAGPDSLRYQMNRFRRDRYPGSVYDPDFVFNSTVYRKGAWVLHMLRHVVGDETFFTALRVYGQRHAYDNAITDDFQADAEEVSGMDLDWFFEPWIYGEGQPRYRVYWNPAACEANGRTSTLVTVVQETNGPQYFKMPLDARFVLRSGEEFWTVLWDSLPEQTFLVETPSPPESLDVDPNEWVLGRVLYVADPMDVSDSDPPGSAVRLRLGTPRPNPAQGRTTIPVHFSPGFTYAAGGEDPAGRDPSADAFPPLSLYDAQGRLTRRLALAERGATAGLYRWDGRDRDGRPAQAGFYFARIEGVSSAARILLLR